MPEPVGVLVFAKAPIPGAVKTRLAPILGALQAARLYRRMAQQCLETAIAAGIGPVELWCAPDPTHPWFASLAARYGLRLVPQRGRDLGERMHAALAEALQRHRHALLIGTDCPALCPEDLRAARDGLDGAMDAVFGPVEDGGYALVATSAGRGRALRGYRVEHRRRHGRDPRAAACAGVALGRAPAALGCGPAGGSAPPPAGSSVGASAGRDGGP